MKRNQKLYEMVIFAILGTMLFVSKLAFEFLPNIHPIALLIAVFTLIYRKKALIPIYLFVFLEGLYAGFSLWWLPYLYLWAILWGAIMLIPKSLNEKKKALLSAIACGLHGLLYGTLYAPAQALMFGLSLEGMLTWVVAGLPWDALHMAGNLAVSILILPLYRVLAKLEQKRNSL